MALLTPEIVYRRKNVMGVPDSGDHTPNKDEIVHLLNILFGVSRGGWVVARTAAELASITPVAETDGEVVLTGNGAGYYQRDSGVWVKGRGFPDTLAKLTVTGGSLNAVQASTQVGVDFAAAQAFVIDVETPNTGNVTVSINGGTPLPVYNISGDQFAAGAWAERHFDLHRASGLPELPKHFPVARHPLPDVAHLYGQLAFC